LKEKPGKPDHPDPEILVMDIYEKAVGASATTAFSIFPRHQDPVLSEGNQAGMKGWEFAENTI
jgi:hypothetical protein